MAPNGDRFIVLDDGRRYEGKPGTTDYRIVEFGRLGRRIEPAELRVAAGVDQGDPDRHADRPRRAASSARSSSGGCRFPIASMVLTLLAVPLAYVNPRIGTSFNLIAAAFLYMLYSNCLNIVQSFIAQGKLGFAAGLVTAARDRDRPRAAALRPSAVAVRRLPPSAIGPRPPTAMKTLTRYIGREVLAVDPADLQRARRCCSRSST